MVNQPEHFGTDPDIESRSYPQAQSLVGVTRKTHFRDSTHALNENIMGTLFESEVPMQHCHRLFFALKPSPIEANLTGLIRDAAASELDPVINGRLHLTLGITSDYAAYPQDVAQRLASIGEHLAGDPFLLPLDRLSGSERSIALRPNKRPAALSALQKQIDDQLRYWNLMRTGWSFNPHVTLGYRAGLSFLRPITPLIWDIRDLVLIHSVVGATRHIELSRWPLARRQFDLFSL
jgi:2'-5' RNA ligase